MRPSFHGFVTYITESGLTVFTRQKILSVALAIYTSTCGAFATKFDVDVGVLCHTHVFFNHIESYFDWLDRAFIAPMIRLLFKVLLAFSRVHADPAKPSPALRALYLCAATASQSDSDTTFDIWAYFRALLHIDLV